MGHHSIAETKNKLSELVDRALAGEKVVVTRHGQPMIEFHPVEQTPQTSTKEALDWLAEMRARQPLPKGSDSTELISQMRDEWDR